MVIYDPSGEHTIIRLSTPLDCVILDTEDLCLCRQTAKSGRWPGAQGRGEDGNIGGVPR